MYGQARIAIGVVSASLLLGLLMASSLPGLAKDKDEMIQATAFGTGPQQGTNYSVKLFIYQYSTPADKQLLVEAFEKGKNQGLVNALQKMKAVGRVEVSGTTGNECSYIRMFPTPTGRKIVFATNRRVMFGGFTGPGPYNLTVGMIEINDQDKNKSSGTLYPAAQLTVDSQGELQWDLAQNPWKLENIVDWAGTPGVN